MTYGDITPEALKLVLGETYEGGTYTLEDELNTLGENIIRTNFYGLPATGKESDLNGLTVYTETHVGILISSVFGDLCLVKVKRNP